MSNLQNLTTMELQFGNLNINSSVEARLQELDYTTQELQVAIADHKSNCNGKPSVYVGTYHKYNEGSLCGLWIDLSSFNNYDDFCNFCKAIHADESDPELMAQDFEGFPEQWYNEGFMNREDFDKIIEYSELCDQYGKEAVDDYMEYHNELDGFEDAFSGEWDSEEDFARNLIEEIYDIDKAMGNLSVYFDYSAFARDLFITDYQMGSNGNVFRVA